MRLALCLLMLLSFVAAFAQDEPVGKRPYEMDWANRFQDDHPPLIDFEAMEGWTVKTENSAATILRTREQQLWDKYVAKFTYRATGDSPTYLITPPQPVKIEPVAKAVEAEPIVCERLASRIVAFRPRAAKMATVMTAAGIEAETVIPTRRPR